MPLGEAALYSFAMSSSIPQLSFINFTKKGGVAVHALAELKPLPESSFFVSHRVKRNPSNVVGLGLVLSKSNISVCP